MHYVRSVSLSTHQIRFKPAKLIAFCLVLAKLGFRGSVFLPPSRWMEERWGEKIFYFILSPIWPKCVIEKLTCYLQILKAAKYSKLEC